MKFSEHVHGLSTETIVLLPFLFVCPATLFGKWTARHHASQEVERAASCSSTLGNGGGGGAGFKKGIGFLGGGGVGKFGGYGLVRTLVLLPTCVQHVVDFGTVFYRRQDTGNDWEEGFITQTMSRFYSVLP